MILLSQNEENFQIFVEILMIVLQHYNAKVSHSIHLTA